MMDIYDYYLLPTTEELKKESNVDKLFIKYKLNVPNIARYMFIKPQSNIEYNKSVKPYFRDITINYGLDNWKNKVLELKEIYCCVQNYVQKSKNAIEEEKSFYEYWCKTFIDRFFINISSLYDKSAHILNYLYELNVKKSIKFNHDVMTKLKDKNETAYNIYFAIYKKYKKESDEIRNNATHNFSELFPNIYYMENADGTFTWKRGKELSIDEGLKKIENLINILEEYKKQIEETLEEKYKK